MVLKKLSLRINKLDRPAREDFIVHNLIIHNFMEKLKKLKN